MFDEDMRAVIGDLGEPVTIGGKTVQAVVGEISEAVALQLEGYLPDTTASFTFRKRDLAVMPKAQDVLVYNGVTYRVLVPVRVPQDGSVVLECGAKGK